MNRNLLLQLIISSTFSGLFARSGALIYETGTPTLNSSAILEVISTDKGILIPIMTTAERDAITDAASEDGLLIFNTDNGYFEYYRDASTGWVTLRPGNEFVEGTGQAGQVSFWTGSGNTSKITGDNGLFYDISNTFLGINNPSPSFTLDIDGDVNSTGDITASSVSATSVTATNANFNDIDASGTVTAPFGVFDNFTTNSALSSSTILADYISSAYGRFGNADVEGSLNSNTISAENFRLEDSESDFYINIESPDNLTDNYSLTFPGNTGAANQFLQTDGNGNLSWADPVISNESITFNNAQDGGIAFNNSGTLSSFNGIVVDNTNTFFGINNSSPSYSLDVDGQIRTVDSDTRGAIIFGNGNNANETWLVSSSLTTAPAATFTLPVDSGNDGDYLTVDANGNLVWTSPTAQDDFVVDASATDPSRQIAFFNGSNTISGSSMSFDTNGDLQMPGGINSASLTTIGYIISAGTVSAVTGSLTNLDINNSLTVSQISLSNPDGGLLILFSSG